ncbi:hypothetical protein NLM33_39445 [Bradyrhizobium sp. CCGUVB1N3]|uniref:hypothetical protein n=1 Tax=Bradyrhizobium sp. CCGUVB1N3 TaxID=2949629 RepID=UPI0020B19380|nr:hypothetical protein [Bradyrhizobium sp. CCGUVB1N3]MCP3476296.1 hypothetical protein [Bradyrhizobium sp. CCGUVB1N3]
MKKTKRRSSPRIAVRMAPKRLVDQHCLAPGTVLIDRIFDRDRGRFEDPDEPQIEGNFYLEAEEDTDGLAPDGRPDAMTALVGAAFEAAAPPELRRKLRHGQALCVVILVPTDAWVLPVADHFRRSFGDRWLQHTRSGPNQRGLGCSSGSSAVSGALAGGQSVVGISADVSLLPRALVGAADLTIRLGPPTGAVVKAAIGRFAGRASIELDDAVLAELDLDDLVAAFRPGTGAQRIAQRLAAAAAALRAITDLKEAHTCSS